MDSQGIGHRFSSRARNFFFLHSTKVIWDTQCPIQWVTGTSRTSDQDMTPLLNRSWVGPRAGLDECEKSRPPAPPDSIHIPCSPYRVVVSSTLSSPLTPLTSIQSHSYEWVELSLHCSVCLHVLTSFLKQRVHFACQFVYGSACKSWGDGLQN